MSPATYMPISRTAASLGIIATTMPQRPKNLVEKVVCDADLIHIGTKEFFRKNDLLKEEIERLR